MTPLRICMIAPIAWSCPPRGYGPWEAATSTLTEALVARGHDVTLFAAGGSATAGTLRVTAPHPYEEAPLDVKVWEALHLGTAMAAAAGGVFEVIHAQCDFPALPYAHFLPVPMVVTLHGLGPPATRDAVLPIWRAYMDAAHYVAISQSDRHSDLRYAATIHHGLDLDAWPVAPDPGPDAPLAFFGRSHPEKGPAAAIDAARTAGLPIRLAGIVADRAYHATQVKPRLGADAIWVGTVEGAGRARFLGAAKSLLHLIAFDEPFGLSVIEAMVCGTPVIALRRGSMPELIEEGVTGYLVDRLEDVPGAIGRLSRIDRAACAARARARFGADVMARTYEALYRTVIRP
ncbi:glycosyltransferase family 4 protein [uncultured Jannaschia sp.]|uniref:glycosyltransferase family 4 protein n=1 Tax=uncultured Jannaschia sp. TaxID=293347 RepID=UPI002635B84F|nr:glycosyltransferase family 4 protein [uncultured Jannaschia sp.]